MPVNNHSTALAEAATFNEVQALLDGNDGPDARQATACFPCGPPNLTPNQAAIDVLLRLGLPRRRGLPARLGTGASARVAP